MSKRKVKDISERYSFVNYSSDCFADPDYSFQVLEFIASIFCAIYTGAVKILCAL